MRKTLFCGILLLSALSFSVVGCRKAPAAGSGKMPLVCGLPPIAGLVARVGGDFVEVQSLLPEGRSPHDYAPRPSEIRQASRGKLFFSTDMLFEKKAADALKKNMTVCDVTRTIPRRLLKEADDAHHHEDDHGHHHHDDGALDPHVWLSPTNAAVIVQNVQQELCRLAPAQAEEYRKNADHLLQELSETGIRMKTLLKPYAGRTFFVYHPSFGYFADAAGLHQRAIEINGREATPKQLARVIREAKEDQIRVIFVQKQFNPVSAKALADQLHCEVLPMDPLAQDLPANLRQITDALVRGFGGESK